MKNEQHILSKCCNSEIKEESGWIEHDGFGHPGGIVFVCSKCNKPLPFWEQQDLLKLYYNQSQANGHR